jgi:HK97 family phage portal protein
VTSLLGRMRGDRDIGSLDDYVSLMNSFAFGGMEYGLSGANVNLQQTLSGQATELAPKTLVGLATHCYESNGPVFACMLVRMLVFSSIDFVWQRLLKGLPSELWANDPNLRALQRPWPNATTQDLLVQMIQHVDLAGNSYVAYVDGDLVCLRPDWVDIVLTPRYLNGQGPDADGNLPLGGGQIGWRKLGIVYTEGGLASKHDPVFLEASEVAHFAPIPDPLALYRGMSWLTPILNEIRADQSMTRHQQKFFDNGATPNLIVKYQPGMTLKTLKAFKDMLEDKHEGVENAYKTLHLAPGADPIPVGTNLQQIDFKSVRGGGETRIASAAGVPPVIAGFSEGLQAATYSNYSQARRRFADATMHPLWQNVAGSLETLIPQPITSRGVAANRLWYDSSRVAFLREDEKDKATIQQMEAATMNTLITAGYNADSVVRAVIAQDWNLLEHSGLTSVQLLPPGTSPLKPPPNGTNSLTNGGSNVYHQ